LNVDRHVFVGRPRFLPLPRGVHDIARLAGRPGGILMMWPALMVLQCKTKPIQLRQNIDSKSLRLWKGFVTWSRLTWRSISWSLNWMAQSTYARRLLNVSGKDEPPATTGTNFPSELWPSKNSSGITSNIQTRQVNSALHPSGVGKSSTSLPAWD